MAGLERKLGCMEDDKGTPGRERLILVILAMLLVIAFIVSLGIGRYHVSIPDIITILKDFFFGTNNFHGDPQARVVVTVIRMPRLLLCILVGACLSASGAAYQGLFRNPMVSPDILGVSTGASVGACIAILLSAPTLVVQLSAFIFGIVSVLLVIGIASAVGKGNPQTLIMILAGMVMSSVFNAFNTLIRYIAIDVDDKLADITFWTMGSFAKSGNFANVGILLVLFLISGVPLLLIRWRINVLAFGEEEAAAMGVDTRKIRMIIIVCATMMTASSIALIGNVGWVGMTLPHITRLMVGPNYKILLPTTMLSGALFLVIVDNIARGAAASEIPIGVLTALIGAPIFIFLIFKGKRGWV